MPRQTRKPHTKPRRKTKRQFKVPKFARILMALMLVAASLYCVKAVAMKISRPYVISYSESRETEEIKKQIAIETAENARLKRETAYLQTNAGKEAEARKLSWVKPGETALVLPQPQKSQLELQEAAAMKETFWQAVGRKLVGVFVKTR